MELDRLVQMLLELTDAAVFHVIHLGDNNLGKVTGPLIQLLIPVVGLLLVSLLPHRVRRGAFTAAAITKAQKEVSR